MDVDEETGEVDITFHVVEKNTGAINFGTSVGGGVGLAGFIGYSKNAIQWQVWAALLVWLLARFQAFLSQWPHSFSRLMALLRSHVWERIHALELLRFHGTAGGLPRMMATPDQAYLPGLEPR